jgi:hypothetical protein
MQRRGGVQVMGNWRSSSSLFPSNRVRLEETWQAKDEVVCLPEGNTRSDAPPMAISMIEAPK